MVKVYTSIIVYTINYDYDYFIRIVLLYKGRAAMDGGRAFIELSLYVF